MHRLSGLKPSFSVGKSITFNQGEKFSVGVSVHYLRPGALQQFLPGICSYCIVVSLGIFIEFFFFSLVLVAAFMYSVKHWKAVYS